MAIHTDPVSYSRDMILRRGIDRTILNLAFGGIKYNGERKNLAVEIDNVLMEACDTLNLLSGDIVDIELSECKKLNTTGTVVSAVYYVPPEARQNRDIREALSLRTPTVAPYAGASVYQQNNSPVMNALTNMAGSVSTTYTDGNAYVEIVDTNTVAITTSETIISTHSILAVDLVNKARLMSLKKGSYPLFYKYALAYVKAVIYNNRIAIKKASAFGGHDISEIDSEIDNYSSANEDIDNMIEEGLMTKMLVFSDESKLQNIYQQFAKM